MVFSFDIFDTCLVRLCGEPHNLIEVLSKDFFDEKDELQRQMFIANRVKADDGSGGGLVAIYERMASGCPLPMTAHDMAECEMQLEHKMLVAIATTKKLVDALRANGRIMFVSDMYLPSDFLRDVLKEQGFYHDGDLLYVSDEHNASKRDGSLFQLIHEREGIPYRKWHHYGDNKHSDYHIPSRFGIHAHYLHFPYLHYEKLWIAHPSLQYQYSSILAGVSRAARLHHDVPAEQGAFVSNIAALTLTSWVVHILTDASNRGISRLYFCARGTHAEYIIARKLAPLFPRIAA